MDSISAIVIDCGIGNIDSVVNSIKRAGISVITCADSTQLKNTSATSIVLPGVGTFGRMMSLLDSGGWIPVLSDLVIEQKKPFLGICVGMQILANSSQEFGHVAGLGWIDGQVNSLATLPPVLRVPHVGWNNVQVTDLAPEFYSLNNKDFYFVHSFYFSAAAKSVMATVDYGVEFACMVRKNNIFGVQFHPEKSAVSGKQFFLEYFKTIGCFAKC